VGGPWFWARNHRAQMAELQESCHAKLRDMRQVHDTQLAAATKENAEAPAAAAAAAAAAVDAAAADLARLRADHEEEMKSVTR